MSDLSIHVEGGSTTGDNIIKKNKTVHDLIDDVIEDLDSDVKDNDLIGVDVRQIYVIKEELKACDESFLNDVVSYISGHTSHHNKLSKLRAFVVFLLNCRVVDADAEFITQKNSAIVSGVPLWLFNLVRHDDEPITLQLSKLLRFLERSPAGYAKDGVAFLSKLRDKGGLNCATCTGSVETDSVNGVLVDWMTERKGNFEEPEVKDIFELRESRNLTIKCGNCVSDIHEGNKAKSVLERP